MKKIFQIILIVSLLIIPFQTNATEYVTDLVITSNNGIWTDTRAYSTLNAAILAMGANERTILIPSPQTVTTLTVPSNVTLKFIRDGAINNSGQLIINTKNIVSKDRQIFTGSGDIDFISGITVRSSWFSDIDEAISVTNDDNLTLIISEQDTITTNSVVGNNVTLKWEASDNKIIINSGITLSNIENIQAGNYQLFAGAGDFDFNDGTTLNLYWFRRLRSVITWVENELVTIIVPPSYSIDYNNTATSNIFFDFNTMQGDFIVPISITLTFYSPDNIKAPECRTIFSGAGDTVFTYQGTLYAAWYGFTDTSLQAAYDNSIDGSTIRLCADTWTLSSSVDMVTSNKTVHLIGSAYDNNVGKGTTIYYTGVSYAIKIAGFTTIERMRFDGNSSGAIGLILGNAGGSPIAWKGRATDLFITGFTTAGLQAAGIQLGYIENVYLESNTGSGMKVVTGPNTHCVLQKVRFASNTGQGLLYSTDSGQFKFYGCIFESNGEEGIRSDTTLAGSFFNGCWFENNKTAHPTGGGTTEYQIYLPSNGNDSVIFQNCEFRDPANEFNGVDGNKHIGFDGKLKLIDNRWIGDIVNNGYIGDFLGGASSWLLNQDRVINQDDWTFANVSNRYYNLKNVPEVINLTASATLSATFFNMIITNAGAIGAVNITNVPAKQSQTLIFKQDAEQPLQVRPDPSDKIYPYAPNDDDKLGNVSQKAGDSLIITCYDGSNWTVDSIVGTWVNITTPVNANGKLMCQYDFSIHGGAIGDITLCSIPINSIVTIAKYEVQTAFTSGGAATVQVGVATDDPAGIISQAAFDNAKYAAGYHDADPDNTAANFTTVTGNNRSIYFTIGGANLTAGKMVVWLEYIQTE